MVFEGEVALGVGGERGIGAASAEDVAGIIAFLASDESGSMSGSCLPVSGGMVVE